MGGNTGDYGKDFKNADWQTGKICASHLFETQIRKKRGTIIVPLV